MTLQTWKHEFYPVEAGATEEGEAAQHSLTKWQGLRLPVLQQHGLRITTHNGFEIREIDSKQAFTAVSQPSCALCAHFYAMGRCTHCPLSLVRGGKPCVVRMIGEEITPYEAMTDDHDPEPMIGWLEKAVEYHEANPV